MQQLAELPFDRFTRCIRDLLTAEGYSDVRYAGRVGYRGRNRGGGYDLGATIPSPLSGNKRQKAIVQIKQYPPALHVHQRTLDELRGVCLRVGAAEGVLVTTSDFSSVIRATDTVINRVADTFVPVHLINGADLLDRLARHRLGVKDGIHGDGSLAIDPVYFADPSDRARSKTPPILTGGRHVPSRPDKAEGFQNTQSKPAARRRPAYTATAVMSVTLPLALTVIARQESHPKGGA